MTEGMAFLLGATLGWFAALAFAWTFFLFNTNNVMGWLTHHKDCPEEEE